MVPVLKIHLAEKGNFPYSPQKGAIRAESCPEFRMVDIPKPSKTCSATHRELKPGEAFFSVLFEESGGVRRLDYAAENWTGPPPSAAGWWKSTVPAVGEKKVKLAPNEILLELFEQLAGQPDKLDVRYVLTLLLIRRRLFRYEREEEAETGEKTLIVYSLKQNATFEIPAAMPNAERLREVQEYLNSLLYQ